MENHIETTDRFEHYESEADRELQEKLRKRGFGCFGEYCGKEVWKGWREGDVLCSIYVVGDRDVYTWNHEYVPPDEYENL